MASPETITPQGTGNTGGLAEDTMFYVQTGTVHLSTDGGTTFMPFYQDDRVIFSSGLTVNWANRTTDNVILSYMPI